MKKLLCIILISGIVALFSVLLQIKAIIMVVALIGGFYFIKKSYTNTRECFWLMYFIILSLPISNNNILNYITINILGIGINLLQIGIGIIFLVVLIKNRRYRKIIKSGIGIVFIILCILYIIYFLLGKIKGNNMATVDVVMYLFQCILFYCTYKLVNDKDNIYKLMNITMYALTVNCTFSLIMLLTNKLPIWGIEYNGGRYGGNFITLTIVTISYIFFILYNREKESNKILLIYSLFISILSIIVSQNRTNPILLIISCLAILFISFNNKVTYKNIFRKLFIITLFSAFAVIIGSSIINSDSDFINRYKKITSLSEDVNMKTRINTNNYHINLIISNPFGEGFGEYMPFVDSAGIFRYEDSLNIDNSYINIGRKGGILTLAIYMILIISPIIKLLKNYNISNNAIYLSLVVIYFMTIIASSLLTSQSIHSYAVSTFIWVFIAFMNVKNIVFEEEKANI